MFRQRQRQLLYTARNNQLLANQAYEKVASAKQHVDLLLRTVMDGVYASQSDGGSERIAADEVPPHPLLPLDGEPGYLFGYPGNEITLFMKGSHFLTAVYTDLYRRRHSHTNTGHTVPTT